MLVKICGITRVEDAECAIACGAGAVGFVFWPGSPRFIEPERAAAIVTALPPFVTAVGVFVNQPSAYVNDVAVVAQLGAVQLHGDESVAYAAQITRPVLKAVALPAATDEVLAQWPARTTVLLDAHDPVRRGGTGRTIDWNRAARVARSRRVVLAGGLTAANVAEAITRVQPFGVDISSGIESAPGIKDHTRLRAFFEALSQGELKDCHAINDHAPRS
ncbi:MAG: phosphoribosylanthranilate isomerase [Blastocatellia bacterium]|nr:MAG: phosphoribosylanthranilate isomerase [Blastocatellia bacterium]